MQPNELVLLLVVVRPNVCMVPSKVCMMCAMSLSTALLGRFEMRGCAPVLSLVHGAVQAGLCSVERCTGRGRDGAAVVGRMTSCSEGRKGGGGQRPPPCAVSLTWGPPSTSQSLLVSHGPRCHDVLRESRRDADGLRSTCIETKSSSAKSVYGIARAPPHVQPLVPLATSC